MTKEEALLQAKSLSKWLVIAVVGVLAIVGTVKAFSGSAQNVFENCDGCTVQSEASSDASGFGASGSRYPNGLSADGTSPVAGEVRGTTLTMTGESQLSTVVAGGSVLTTSTPGNTTFTAAQICDNSVILMEPGLTAVNLTLPATSTLYADCLDTDGDYKEVVLRNTTSTANSVMTLVAGTGIVSLGTPTSTAFAGDQVSTGEQARLTFTRLGDAAGQISVEAIIYGNSD